MILDLLSAMCLWVTDKTGKIAPWRSWIVPVCLFVLFVAIAVLFVRVSEAPQDTPSPVAVVEYVVEIEALKARCSATEANILALAEAINRVAVAIDKVQTPLSLGNLATKGELELLRLEVEVWKKELDNIGIIHSRSSSTFNMWLDEVKQSLEELEEELTAHTDNTTIHTQEAK